MRVRLIILVTVVLLFGTLVMVPSIIEAKRSKSIAAETARWIPFRGESRR